MVANFSVRVAVAIITELNLLATISHHNKDFEGRGHEATAKDPKNVEAMRQTLESAENILRQGDNLQEFVKSGHVHHALERLRSWTTDDPRLWGELYTRSCNLRNAIEIEYKEHLFYAYPKAKGQKFNDWETDWEKIHAVFPVRVESFCATDCYALEHNTASVFHSMRVAEIGLRALAKERRITLPKNKPVEWGTWQEIIKALEDEIKRIGQTWKAGSKKDAALDFYSGARADLNGFKDEYRNLVMHVREQYDEFQAARALTRVHDFMARLAEKVDPKTKRIKWNRSS